MKRIWVYDLEVFRNLFTATFIDRDSDDEYFFAIYKDRDDRKQLHKFLKEQVGGLIGYNCNTYDMQILEYLWRYPNCNTFQLRNYSDRITSTNQSMPDVPEYQFRLPQLDLFHALSLSVKAKRTSLKWCEVGIDFENVEDMPDTVENEDFLQAVYKYNKNDVLATKALFYKNRHEIELRKTLTQREGINLMNSTEPGMAKKLFASYLSKAMDIPEYELKKLGTDRNEVIFKDIILPNVYFNDASLCRVLDRFKSEKLSTFDSFNVKYKGLTFEFGLGGLHAFGSPGIYESNKEFIIKTVDVKSYYPNLIIKNKFCPEHLDSNTFLSLYEGFYKERSVIPKSDPRNYILKILLNSTYGLTNDQYSFLRDKKVTMEVTINGQLLLTMLAEWLSNIPNSQLLMVNTDGLEIKIPRIYEHIYLDFCEQWEELTQLELEHDEYSKIIARDINNYISIYTNNKTKCKGAFEFENIPLHKDKSFSIIPEAIYNYFVKDIPLKNTINNCTDIFKFTGAVRAKQDAKFEIREVNNKELSIKKLSKTVRYYISKKGGYLFKKFSDGREQHVEAPFKSGKFKKDWKVTIFNRAWFPEDFEIYNIDKVYYIHKAKQQVAELVQKDQLQLF